MLLVLTPESMLNSRGESIDGDYPPSSLSTTVFWSRGQGHETTLSFDDSSSDVVTHVKSQPNGNISVTMNGDLGTVSKKGLGDQNEPFVVKVALPEQLSNANAPHIDSDSLSLSTSNVTFSSAVVQDGALRITFTNTSFSSATVAISFNNLSFIYSA